MAHQSHAQREATREPGNGAMPITGESPAPNPFVQGQRVTLRTSGAPQMPLSYTVMASRFLLSLALGLVAASAGSLALRAQAADSVLSVDDGRQVRPIARLIEGRWVADAKCTPGKADTASSVPERLSATGEIRVGQVRAVVPGSPEWLRLLPSIVDLFERREREQRLAINRTSDAPRAVDWIYTAEAAGRTVHYFEASRRVATASADVDHDTDPPGTVRVAVAGFLHDVGGRPVSLGTKSELRWEQDGLPAGPSLPDLRPLGVVTHGNRTIWVMKGHSGTVSWFALYDVSAEGTQIALSTRSTGC